MKKTTDDFDRLYTEEELNEMWPDFMYDVYGYPGEAVMPPIELQGQTFGEMRNKKGKKK